MPVTFVASHSIPAAPTVGLANDFRRPATTFVAIDDSVNEYIECVAWYSYEVIDLSGKDRRFSRILEKDAAIEFGYIQ